MAEYSDRDLAQLQDLTNELAVLMEVGNGGSGGSGRSSLTPESIPTWLPMPSPVIPPPHAPFPFPQGLPSSPILPIDEEVLPTQFHGFDSARFPRGLPSAPILPIDEQVLFRPFHGFQPAPLYSVAPATCLNWHTVGHFPGHFVGHFHTYMLAPCPCLIFMSPTPGVRVLPPWLSQLPLQEHWAPYWPLPVPTPAELPNRGHM